MMFQQISVFCLFLFSGLLAAGCGPSLDEQHQKAKKALNSQQWSKAEKLSRQILQEDSTSASAWNMFGASHLERNNLAKASQAFRKASRLDTGNYKPHYNLGLTRLEQNQPQKALPALEKAADLAPGLADVYNNLGFAYFQMRKKQEAIRAFEKATQLDSSMAQAHFNLANARYRQGQVTESIHSYRHVLQLDSNHARALHGLGIALIMEKGRKAGCPLVRKAKKKGFKNIAPELWSFCIAEEMEKAMDEAIREDSSLVDSAGRIDVQRIRQMLQPSPDSSGL